MDERCTCAADLLLPVHVKKHNTCTASPITVKLNQCGLRGHRYHADRQSFLEKKAPEPCGYLVGHQTREVPNLIQGDTISKSLLTGDNSALDLRTLFMQGKR
jgi:hypothetical protein